MGLKWTVVNNELLFIKIAYTKKFYGISFTFSFALLKFVNGF